MIRRPPRSTRTDTLFPYTRLDSTWSWSSQQQLWTLNVGDFIRGNLAWSRPTRMAGVQWRRDFGLQPQLLTDPIPQFFGEAADRKSTRLNSSHLCAHSLTSFDVKKNITHNLTHINTT